MNTKKNMVLIIINLDKLIINEKILNDYKNGLLYALVPFIGLC